ncbi:hypothetical protein KC345_g10507, partial [Hortaea werneckii]
MVLVEAFKQYYAKTAGIDPCRDGRDADRRYGRNAKPAKNYRQRKRQLDGVEQPPAAHPHAQPGFNYRTVNRLESGGNSPDKHQLAVQDQRDDRRLHADPHERNQQREHAETRNCVYDTENGQHRYRYPAMPRQEVTNRQRNHQRDQQRQPGQIQMLKQPLQQIIVMAGHI